MTKEFNIRIANLCGINAAVVAEYIYSSVMTDSVVTEQHDGIPWCRCSIKMFTAELPFMTYSMVENALEKLVRLGVIKKGCFNANHFDHTNWYTFTDYGCQFYE